MIAPSDCQRRTCCALEALILSAVAEGDVMLQAVWPPERIVRSDRIRIRPQRRWNGKAFALALDALSARRANALWALARQFGLLLGELLLELSPDVRRGALSTGLGLLPLGLGFSAVQRPQQLKDLGRGMTAVAFEAHPKSCCFRLLQGGAEWVMPWRLERVGKVRPAWSWALLLDGVRPRDGRPLDRRIAQVRRRGLLSPGNAQGAIAGGRLAVGHDWGIRLR